MLSSYLNILLSYPLLYSVNADRMLANRCDGTFLCIPADRQTLKEGGVHVYTVHVIQ